VSKNEEHDPEILEHEPVPGYRKAFYIMCVASVVYLAFIFYKSMG